MTELTLKHLRGIVHDIEARAHAGQLIPPHEVLFICGAFKDLCTFNARQSAIIEKIGSQIEILAIESGVHVPHIS